VEFEPPGCALGVGGNGRRADGGERPMVRSSLAREGHPIMSRKALTITLVAAAAVILAGFAAMRAGCASLQRKASEYAQQAESQIDAGGLQQHLGRDEGLSSESLLAQAGQTPEATLWAYYYYKDRGMGTKLRPLVAADSLEMVPAEDGQGMSARSQSLRGIVVDHVDVTEDRATLYMRSWFSLGTQAQGGRPYVFQLVKEDGRWKVSIPLSLQLTMDLSKGKNNLGFYDGTKEWWK
jgi:hypothetical protein